MPYIRRIDHEKDSLTRTDLCLLMGFAVPAMADTDDYMYDLNDDGTAIIMAYTGTDTTLTIPVPLDRIRFAAPLRKPGVRLAQGSSSR